MKRRHLLAVVFGSLVAGCQSALNMKTSTGSPSSTVELAVTNKSDTKDVFDLVVVVDGETVEQFNITISPGRYKEFVKTWKGETFAIFGMSNEFRNFEIQAIDKDTTFNRPYRTNFVIKESGDVVKKGFGPDK